MSTSPQSMLYHPSISCSTGTLASLRHRFESLVSVPDAVRLYERASGYYGKSDREEATTELIEFVDAAIRTDWANPFARNRWLRLSIFVRMTLSPNYVPDRWDLANHHFGPEAESEWS